MIGDQHINAAAVGLGHSINTGDAVVNGDDDVGIALRGEGNDFRGQSITVLETIGDDKFDFASHGGKCAHSHCTGGRAIGVVVRDNQHAFFGANCIRQQDGCCFDMSQLRRR